MEPIERAGVVELSARQCTRRNAEDLIKACVGVSTRVRVVASGTVERSLGKAKRVIDLRGST